MQVMSTRKDYAIAAARVGIDAGSFASEAAAVAIDNCYRRSDACEYLSVYSRRERSAVEGEARARAQHRIPSPLNAAVRWLGQAFRALSGKCLWNRWSALAKTSRRLIDVLQDDMPLRRSQVIQLNGEIIRHALILRNCSARRLNENQCANLFLPHTGIHCCDSRAHGMADEPERLS